MKSFPALMSTTDPVPWASTRPEVEASRVALTSTVLPAAVVSIRLKRLPVTSRASRVIRVAARTIAPGAIARSFSAVVGPDRSVAEPVVAIAPRRFRRPVVSTT